MSTVRMTVSLLTDEHARLLVNGSYSINETCAAAIVISLRAWSLHYRARVNTHTEKDKSKQVRSVCVCRTDTSRWSDEWFVSNECVIHPFDKHNNKIATFFDRSTNPSCTDHSCDSMDRQANTINEVIVRVDRSANYVCWHFETKHQTNIDDMLVANNKP
jgi:hypothetical protein